jgi:hypothetical protein
MYSYLYFFSYKVYYWLWCQGNAGLIEGIGEFFSFSISWKNLRRICVGSASWLNSAVKTSVPAFIFPGPGIFN